MNRKIELFLCSAYVDSADVSASDAHRFQMSSFRKEKDCPSSYELADAVVGQLNGDQALRIAGHLGSCDFCAAEIEFYKHYPPVIFAAEPGPIPDPLFELAQSTLTKESVSRSRLEFLIDDAT